MVLFLLTAMPLLAAFLAFLPWNQERVPRRFFLGQQFLRGVLLFFPAWLVLLLLRRVAGFSYSGFPLFLSLLVHSHLAPVLLALGAFILVTRRLQYPSTDESVFLVAGSFLAGFYGMLNLADFIAEYGRWGSHVLFLLPASRLALVLFLATIAQRFERWEGRDGILYCAAAAGAAVVACLASFLQQISLGLLGFLMCAGLFAAAVLLAAGRFPQVLRERPSSAFGRSVIR